MNRSESFPQNPSHLLVKKKFAEQLGANIRITKKAGEKKNKLEENDESPMGSNQEKEIISTIFYFRIPRQQNFEMLFKLFREYLVTTPEKYFARKRQDLIYLCSKLGTESSSSGFKTFSSLYLIIREGPRMM